MRLFPFHVSAAVAKHLTRLTALYISQAAAAARAGLIPEHRLVGLFNLVHKIQRIFIAVPQLLYPAHRCKNGPLGPC
jgi:hypothetical protein